MATEWIVSHLGHVSLAAILNSQVVSLPLQVYNTFVQRWIYTCTLVDQDEVSLIPLALYDDRLDLLQ